MSLDTLQAFPSHTGFTSDRLLVTLFAGTAMLLCIKQYIIKHVIFLSLTVFLIPNLFTEMILDM